MAKFLKKSNLKKIPLPGCFFVAGMVVYAELILHLWVTESLQLGNLIAVLCFGLGCGATLGLITSVLPQKGRKWASVTVALVVAVFYIAQFILSETYQNFMTVETMIAGAGGIAQDYLALTFTMIGRNLGRIALMLAPILVYAIWGAEPSMTWKRRAVTAALCVVGYGLGLAAVFTLTDDAKLLKDAYHFDNAVRSMGLSMGLTLDTIQGAKPEESPEFVLEIPEATAAPETKPEEGPQEETEPAVEYGYNVLPMDFGEAAQASGQKAVASIHNYVNSLEPSRQNEFTGMFKGKNLILITAEAFSAEVIDPELTPTLYRMATKGIQFKEYYQPAWGASTTTGEFSNLIGLVPTKGGSSMNETYQQDLFLTMGNQLQKLGYHSTAYHNHLKDFYHRNNTHPHLGYDQFIARYGGLEIKGSWPESDLEMIDVTVPQYIDNQPFSIYYMTVSGHCEYSLKGNDMTEKNWDKVQHLNHSDIVKGYIAANLEFEYAMESLVRQLEEAGIADDTLVVIATDHYPYGLERSKTWNNTVDHLAELYGVKDYDQFLRDHNALIMWSGAFEDMDIVVDTPVYSLDILPTVSNLFGVEYDSRLLVGRDVFSDAEPLVLWPDYNWITEKGTYCDGEFTPRKGVSVEEGYVQRINSIVKNKIKFSEGVVDMNYYDYVLKYLNEQNG
ncbi:MAG: LTA synthase family protein [Faecousia sp.]